MVRRNMSELEPREKIQKTCTANKDPAVPRLSCYIREKISSLASLI